LRPKPFRKNYAAFGLTLGANVAGLPALQIPDLSKDAAADFGLQLIGPPWSDAAILSAV
jgi:Asp-tRNA(Asn)/Glu-tRNA(Gln) amidotransferase A subunit family amidase